VWLPPAFVAPDERPEAVACLLPPRLTKSPNAGEDRRPAADERGMEARIREAMRRSEKLQAKQLKADVSEIERDAKEADSS